MKTYEYKEEELTENEIKWLAANKLTIMDWLNRHGVEGWQLVWKPQFGDYSVPIIGKFVFMREIV